MQSSHRASLRKREEEERDQEEDDLYESVYSRNDPHILRQKMTDQQRVTASVEGFKKTKLGAKEVGVKRVIGISFLGGRNLHATI